MPQPTDQPVPTGKHLVHHPSFACDQSELRVASHPSRIYPYAPAETASSCLGGRRVSTEAAEQRRWTARQHTYQLIPPQRANCRGSPPRCPGTVRSERMWQRFALTPTAIRGYLYGGI